MDIYKNKVLFLREEYGNGQGTFTYPNGRYSGEWEEGKKQGQGTFTWFNGETGTKGNGETGKNMVKEHSFGLMETYTKGNTRTVIQMA